MHAPKIGPIARSRRPALDCRCKSAVRLPRITSVGWIERTG
jgi:hypothetical protein